MSASPTYPANHKFRPYFTISELQEVIRCLKASSHSVDLLRYMETFVVQIERGTRSPSITNALSLEQRLGVAPVPNYSKGKPEYSIHELYQIWCSNPEFLSPPQLVQVHQYRWESDLMTPEESSIYESKILGSSTNASSI